MVLTLGRYLLPVAQLGARSVMLRIPLPEYADGTLYSVQEHRDNTMNTRRRVAQEPWRAVVGCWCSQRLRRGRIWLDVS